MKHEMKCTTQRCIDDIVKYGAICHSVVSDNNGENIWCERCGGRWDGEKFVHQCRSCGTDVEPGELTGLFVPHNCAPCQQKVRDADIAAGRICRMCHSPRCDCCC